MLLREPREIIFSFLDLAVEVKRAREDIFHFLPLEWAELYKKKRHRRSYESVSVRPAGERSSWGPGSGHQHTASPRGLGFPKTRQVGSKGQCPDKDWAGHYTLSVAYPQESPTTLHGLRQSHQNSGAGSTDHNLLVEEHQARGKKNQRDGLSVQTCLSLGHRLPIPSEGGEVTAGNNINAVTGIRVLSNPGLALCKITEIARAYLQRCFHSRSCLRQYAVTASFPPAATMPPGWPGP